MMFENNGRFFCMYSDDESMNSWYSSLQCVLEKSDKATWEHSVRVSELCKVIAEGLGLNSKQINFATLAGLFHDIGKTFMTNTVNYPGKLAEREKNLVFYHPLLGERFISIFCGTFPSQVAEGITFHHERLNGRGYPYSLCGEEIPLIPRMVAVADVFDAMNSSRPYRGALSKKDIVAELDRPGYDVKVVSALLKHHGREYNYKIKGS